MGETTGHTPRWSNNSTDRTDVEHMHCLISSSAEIKRRCIFGSVQHSSYICQTNFHGLNSFSFTLQLLPSTEAYVAWNCREPSVAEWLLNWWPSSRKAQTRTLPKEIPCSGCFFIRTNPFKAWVSCCTLTPPPPPAEHWGKSSGWWF